MRFAKVRTGNIKEVTNEPVEEELIMKSCCTSFSFNRGISSGQMDLEQYLQICQRLGLQGVEFWDEHVQMYLEGGKTIRNLREKARALGLAVVTIAVNNHDFTSPDPSAREKDIAQVFQWMDVIEEIGSKILRVLPGDLIALNKDEESLYPFVRSCFEKCLREAEKRKICLAVENCPQDTDPKVILPLVKDFDSPYLKTCPDIGNIRANIRYPSFRSLLPYAVHVHAKTYQFDSQGEEMTIEYRKVMNMLKEIHFNRYVSVEFEGEGNETEGVEKSVTLVRKYL